MKQSNDNDVFWGVVFLFIGIFYLVRELAVDRLLITHWARIGFFLALALRNFLLHLRQKRSRAGLIQENDEMAQLIRLKSYRSALLSSLLPLLISGTGLRRWGGCEEIELIGLGLLYSAFILFLILLLVPSPYIVKDDLEKGGSQ